MALEFKEITTPERSRTYIFPDGELTILDVVRVAVSPSGSHRLECDDNSKFIVPTGWLGIEIDTDDWSF